MNDMRRYFPIYTHQPSLIYLDSAATTLKPQTVIDAELGYYREYSANVERGLYPLSEKATVEYEQAREKVARFVGADANEIVFTRGTTESLNLLAYALEDSLQPGDEILVSAMEHHSNFLPWQALALRKQLTLRILPFDAKGRLNIRVLEDFVTPRTKIFSFVSVSNVLGTINPIEALVREAKRLNPDIITIIDAAQAIAHLPVDVRSLNCDFLAASGHKMFGPTGIGFLYGKRARLETLSPFHYGGEMVDHASIEGSSWKPAPHKFEAGTPAIAQAIGLGAAVDFLTLIGVDAAREHEKKMLAYGLESFSRHFGGDIHIIGPEDLNERSGVIAFTIEGVHPHDLAQILGDDGICIRAGRHCAEPLHDVLCLPATARLAVSIYTTQADIDSLIEGIQRSRAIFMK